MAVKLVSMRGMYDDEIYDIQQLLTQHGINFYETPGGSWGISAPMFWLHEYTDLEQAKRLLIEYEEERGEKERKTYQENKALGINKTIWQGVKENPFSVLFYTSLALVILYLSVMPFIKMGQPL